MVWARPFLLSIRIRSRQKVKRELLCLQAAFEAGFLLMLDIRINARTLWCTKLWLKVVIYPRSTGLPRSN